MSAAAYAFADEIERTPRVPLRWRGVADVSEEETAASTDPWQGKELSALAEPRPIPRYAVLKRLDPTELYVGGNDDLANELRIAYEALVPKCPA